MGTNAAVAGTDAPFLPLFVKFPGTIQQSLGIIRFLIVYRFERGTFVSVKITKSPRSVCFVLSKF